MLCSKEITEFIALLSVELILDSNVELISRVLASPVVLHCLVDELLDIDDLVVGLLFIELVSLPNEDLVLVMLMARDSDLGPHAQDQERILLKVLKVEHGGRICPVGVRVQLRLHLLLLVYLVPVVLHLVHHWSSFHEVYSPKVD